MSIPGIRILTKYWKRYAMVVLVGACFVVTVKVAQQYMEDAGSAIDISNEQRALPETNSNGEQPPPSASSQAKPMDNPPLADNLSLREMEMRNAKLEAELKYEKLKAELLNRDLKNAKKKSPDGQETDDEDAKLKLQERRREAIKRICRENPKETGLVRTVMTTRQGVTYCHIPGVMETFWLRVLRFINRDYVIDPVSPFDISQKDALERPFIRLKQLKWSRLSEAEKTPLLKSKVFMVVQNPYMRLWELYIHSMVLPKLWSTVGVQIEAKRKSNELLVKQGMKRKTCGKDITFEEFVLYTLETSGPSYDPYHRQCDPCQLTPTYIVKAETARDDMEKVLYHFNLDYISKAPNYSNSTVVRYLTDLVTDVWPRYSRSKAEHCVTPGDIGKSLWRALKLQGLISESALPPLLDTSKTAESVLDMVTSLYIRANLNVESQKARMMVNGYKMLSTNTKDAIKNKYKMDFELFEYSQNVDDVTNGL